MADLVTSRIFTDGERGITAAKLNDIVGSSVIQPAFYTTKPSASSLVPTDVMLAVKAGAFVQTPFQTVIDSVSAGINADSEIWSVRLRSFNAIGNPNFEIDQRNAGNAISNIADGTLPLDRWRHLKSGTFQSTMGQNSQTFAGGNLLVPGTNFRITNSYLFVTLTTAQASLAAGDYFIIRQSVEGPQLRALAGDVHSLSILCMTSVAGGLKFTLRLSDPTGANSLVKLCTIPGPNVVTLITLPNIPVWPNAGTFSVAPGATGYFLDICLAAGTTFMAPAANTWQAGTFFGAPGMDNFCGKPVNSNVWFFAIQHEPGAACSTLMNKPFTGANGNLEECQRYFAKSYPYQTKYGTASQAAGQTVMYASNATFPVGTVRFPRTMAKAPTVTIFDPTTGGANNVRNWTLATTVAASVVDVNETGFDAVNAPSGVSVGQHIMFHYIADTFW